MIRLFAVNISQINYESIYQKSFWQLTKARQERTLCYRFEADRLRSMMGELLIKYAFKECFSYEGPLEFSTNKFGKPEFLNKPDMKFNISHSGDYVICAVSDKEIGVDIEVHKLMDYMSIVKRCFTKDEYYMLRNCNEMTQLGFFYDIWTLKEAYSKCLGSGLSLPLDSYEFCFDDEKITMTYGPEIVNFFHCFHEIQGYSLALCAKAEGPIPEITMLNDYFVRT